MLLNPWSQDESLWQRTIDTASRAWWTILLMGIVSVIAGVIILSINWTVGDLALFVGAYLIFRGIVQILNGPLGGAMSPYYLVTGTLSVIAGIIVMAWPGPSLLFIAIFIGVAIVFYGIMSIAGAIANRELAHYWWIVLVLGILEVLLGLWLLRRPGLTLAVAITVIGFWALFVGVMQIVVSFEIRRLPERLRRG